MRLRHCQKHAATWGLCAMMAAGFPFAGPLRAQHHSADLNKNFVIERSELDYLFTLRNGYAYDSTGDTFSPGAGGTTHSGDFAAPQGTLDMEAELLRAVQLHNAGGYEPRHGTVDGFAPLDIKYLVFDLTNTVTQASIQRFAEVPGGGWKDEHKTTKLVLRRIPAGTFTMGSPTKEFARAPNKTDETQHGVTLTQDYFIGVFEVTQRQWELVMGTKPKCYFNNPAWSTNRPVEQVTYGKAVEFTEKLSQRFEIVLNEKEFSLPTEAQWEYACRATTTNALNNGKVVTTIGDLQICPNVNEVARYKYNGGYILNNNKYVQSNGSVDLNNGTAAVGSYKPNTWGLYDMHGNVEEWCLDMYAKYQPVDAVNPLNNDETGNYHVLRGGSWWQAAPWVRSAARDCGNNNDQSGPDPNSFSGTRGLRVCAPFP